MLAQRAVRLSIWSLPTAEVARCPQARSLADLGRSPGAWEWTCDRGLHMFVLPHRRGPEGSGDE